jgi:hypothetical protein
MPVSTVTFRQIQDRIHEYKATKGRDPESITLNPLTLYNMELTVGEVAIGRAQVTDEGMRLFDLPVLTPDRVGRNEIRIN